MWFVDRIMRRRQPISTLNNGLPSGLTNLYLVAYILYTTVCMASCARPIENIIYILMTHYCILAQSEYLMSERWAAGGELG